MLLFFKLLLKYRIESPDDGRMGSKHGPIPKLKG